MSQYPTSIRLSEYGKEALDGLVKHLQDASPAGVKVNASEAIENAIIEKWERVKPHVPDQPPSEPRSVRAVPKPGQREKRYEKVEDNE